MERAVDVPQESPHDHCWRKHTVASMSDGVLLEKNAYRYSDGSPPRSTGWSVRKGKVKAGATTADWVKSYIDIGYVQVKK